MEQLLRDIKFEKGIKLSGICSNEHGKRAFDVFGESPEWTLCQWGNRYNLAVSDRYMPAAEMRIYPPCGEVSGEKRFYGAAEKFSLRNRMASFCISGGGAAELQLSGSAHYLKARGAGEAWPHLLLEQSLTPRKLCARRHIFVNAECRVEEVCNRMGAEYDPALHTCQFQLYFLLSGRGKDRFWFGISVYDYRYPEGCDDFYCVDGGKADNTGLYIYRVGNRSLPQKSILSLDILPYVKRALSKAHEGGFIRKTAFEDLRFESMNVGWEVQGTFDVRAVVEKLSVELS